MSTEQLAPQPQNTKETQNKWDFSGSNDEPRTTEIPGADKGNWNFADKSDALEGDTFGVKALIEEYADVNDDTMDFAVPESEKQGRVVRQWSPEDTYAKTMRETLGADYAVDGSKGPGYFDSQSYIGADAEEAITARVDNLTTVPESDKFNLKLALINEAVAKKAREEADKLKAERDAGNKERRSTRARKAARLALGRLISR